MEKTTSFAPGKIILSGEYSVVFGSPALAIPSSAGIKVIYEPSNTGACSIFWPQGEKEHKEWKSYVLNIIKHCQQYSSPISGTITIESNLPLGKGMGSSTALIIAITKALLGKDCQNEAKAIEDTLAPNNSGIDFSVIWNNQATVYSKQTGAEAIATTIKLPKNRILIDTGIPNEPTHELVQWVTNHKKSFQSSLDCIEICTKELLSGSDILKIIPKHHRAQCELGVVPKQVQTIIGEIEKSGGCAKVIGAGGKTGGGGMVLAFNINNTLIKELELDTLPLS